MVYTCTRINTYTCACGCACTRAHRVTLTDKHTHGRVCMHVYIYNLTIHITMYTFFWEGGFQGLGKGERSSGRTKGEWVKRNYMCMYVYVYTFCVCIWACEERRKEEKKDELAEILIEGYLRDPLRIKGGLVRIYRRWSCDSARFFLFLLHLLLFFRFFFFFSIILLSSELAKNLSAATIVCGRSWHNKRSCLYLF